MNNPNDGGPAFPLQDWDQCIHSRRTDHGMSLRDYFAAAALQGILSNHEGYGAKTSQVASWSYAAADCMLAARDGKGEA